MQRPTSWFWIVVALILFWPLGLFLLIRRLSSDRTATFKSGRMLKVVYVLLFISGGFMLFSGGFGIFFGLLFIAGGVMVFLQARKGNQRVARYKQYMNLVVNHGQKSVDHIAATLGTESRIVKTELQKMIDLGFFEGAVIDNVTNEIMLAVPQKTGVASAIETVFGSNEESSTERVVVCGGCGANNKVSGNVGNCDYCGSPLE